MQMSGFEEDIQTALRELPSALPTTAEKVSIIKPDAGSTVQKTQAVRLIDVFVLGPAMIYSAMDRTPPKLLRSFIMLVGVGTVLYNLSNYLEQEKRKNGIVGKT
jgi:hypothetical protein